LKKPEQFDRQLQVYNIFQQHFLKKIESKCELKFNQTVLNVINKNRATLTGNRNS